ncbi:histidinol-phosphatase HisJ [Mesobacillus zeae]|uniref:Histidinol-phosphatase n=1 Tax=Mesobacillus zeae TaxID=1917180 RepID=A0A398AZX7_9BACI|nr:histidinol-phosphatase HisJ [Mesobacillus zeae]RID83125.1 histidinol-phosphatase HisJ [Mesobacillus zeae]
MLIDGHVHTPFCPHGTKDVLDDYVERALSIGYTEITFTEHAPLPEGFADPTPLKDSAMKREDLEQYFFEIDKVKNKYKGRIRIHTGLEVDYIEGFEKETAAFLDQTGKNLDDAILSVHFLKDRNGDYSCVDYSPANFEKMAGHYGSVDKVYENYYRTVLKSIEANLGLYKPKRIGHITLVHKFQLKYPPEKTFTNEIHHILEKICSCGYEIDCNGAGTAKPLCRETYPPSNVIEKAADMGIPLIYGSDAHQVKELGQGMNFIRKSLHAAD